MASILNLTAAPKPIRTPRKRRVRRSRKAGLLEQIRQAGRRPAALAAGAVLGGFVPAASFTLAHFEAAAMPALWVLVVGGLVFSALSVYQFGCEGFGSATKSAGFVVLIEGVLIFATTPWLGWTALALLVGLNAVATGSALARS